MSKFDFLCSIVDNLFWLGDFVSRLSLIIHMDVVYFENNLTEARN